MTEYKNYSLTNQSLTVNLKSPNERKPSPCHYPAPSLKPTLSTQWQKEMDSPVKGRHIQLLGGTEREAEQKEGNTEEVEFQFKWGR